MVETRSRPVRLLMLLEITFNSFRYILISLLEYTFSSFRYIVRSSSVTWLLDSIHFYIYCFAEFEICKLLFTRQEQTK